VPYVVLTRSGGIAWDLAFVHVVDLFRLEKLLGVIEIDFFANEYVEQIGVDMVKGGATLPIYSGMDRS
jgi:hypothetical protein